MKNTYNLLKEAAQTAVNYAYAPYSKLKVGAAVLTRSGAVYTASNIENASYGLSICAERNAVVKAVNDQDKEIVAVAIASNSKKFPYPCGACRQFIAEFAPNADIIVVNSKKQSKTLSLKKLLPNSFCL